MSALRLVDRFLFVGVCALTPSVVLAQSPTPSERIAAILPPPPACVAWDTADRLTGTLARRTFPGPPDYEDTAKGDKAEIGLYLQTQRALCPVPGESGTIDSLRLVQLVFNSRAHILADSLIGRSVAVWGTIRRPESGHHHGNAILVDITDVHCRGDEVSHRDLPRLRCWAYDPHP